MNQKTLMVLAIAAVIAVVLALWSTGSQQVDNQRGSDQLLVEGLASNVNDVTRIAITGAESSVTLERGEDGWTVAERGGYRADIAELRRKLLALAEARRLEQKTSNPDNYARLGVAEPGTEDNDGIKLELSGLATPLTLLVGKENFSPSSTYVRYADQADSWLASGSLKMDDDPARWLVKDVLDLPTQRVRRVELMHADGSVVEILKATRELNDFAVLNLPEGRELLSPTSGNSIAGALGSLRLDDVRPADAEADAAHEAINGIFETWDGLRLRTRAWQEGDDRFVAISAEFDQSIVVADEPVESAEALPAESDAAADGDAESDEGDESNTSDDAIEIASDQAEPASGEVAEADVADEVASMQAIVDGWVFKIPSYKYTNMSKPMEDLLKPIEAESSEDG